VHDIERVLLAAGIVLGVVQIFCMSHPQRWQRGYAPRAARESRSGRQGS